MIDIKTVHAQMTQDVWASASLGVPMIKSGSNFCLDIFRRFVEATGPCRVIDFALPARLPLDDNKQL